MHAHTHTHVASFHFVLFIIYLLRSKLIDADMHTEPSGFILFYLSLLGDKLSLYSLICVRTCDLLASASKVLVYSYVSQYRLACGIHFFFILQVEIEYLASEDIYSGGSEGSLDLDTYARHQVPGKKDPIFKLR